MRRLPRLWAVIIVMANLLVMLSAVVKLWMREDLVENSICSFSVASYMVMTGPQVCSMLAALLPEVLLNGARVEEQTTHPMGRFGAVSAKVVLSGVHWIAGLSKAELLVFLDGVETYREVMA